MQKKLEAIEKKRLRLLCQSAIVWESSVTRTALASRKFVDCLEEACFKFNLPICVNQ